MNELHSHFTVTEDLANHRKHAVVIFTHDEKFRQQISTELDATYYLVHCESLLSLTSYVQSTFHHGLLLHLSATTLGNLSPVRFMSDLNQAVEMAPVYALIDHDCPTPLAKLARESADVCLEFPIDYEHLFEVLNKGQDLASEIKHLLESLPHKKLVGGRHSLITFSPKMFRTIEDVEVAARYDVTVLLTGETGSGKTHLAQMIHERSPRNEERFVTVGCGAIPPDLIESELFGYVKGAFTGADRDKEGKFAAAGAGTLLLDEIDTLPLDQQAKLLRVIETTEYEPVGSNETQYSQARLIVAANEELLGLVDSGLFRSDLYYRLNVVNFHLPPLRERPWDIEYLARRFILDYSHAHNIRLNETDSSFIRSLLSYGWPGNIRELKNIIHRAVLYCRRGCLTTNDLPNTLRSSPKEYTPHQDPPKTLADQMDILERRIIEDSLRRNQYSRKNTSNELGIGRVTLYNKMKRFRMLK